MARPWRRYLAQPDIPKPVPIPPDSGSFPDLETCSRLTIDNYVGRPHGARRTAPVGGAAQIHVASRGECGDEDRVRPQPAVPVQRGLRPDVRPAAALDAGRGR